MRRGIALGLFLVLAGCGGEEAANTPPPPPPVPTVGIGAPATVTLAAGEGAGGTVDVVLNIAQQGNYQCDAHAGPPGDGTDAQMVLLQGASELQRDSDSGEGTDARITRVLAPGAYTLRVSEWLHRAANVTVSCIPAPAAPPTQPLAIGTPGVAAVPAAEGPTGQANFLLTIAAPGNYQCDAHAGPPGDGTDAQMMLLQGETELAQNSDDGEGTDARITRELAPGTYTVRVWEWMHRAASITVTCIPAVAAVALPVGVAGPLTLGTPAAVAIPAVAAEGPEGQRDFMLGLVAPGRVQCTAHGEQNGEARDAQMAIVQNGTILQQDSDSGEGFDAQITFDATPGAYSVRVWEWLRRDANITVTCIPAP